MKEEKVAILIHRYDIKGVAETKKEATNLLALLSKGLSYERVKVMYVDDSYGRECRQQVKLYNVDKVIAHFDGKVGSGDTRFMDAWKKYLKVLKKIKVLKVKELEKEKS